MPDYSGNQTPQIIRLQNGDREERITVPALPHRISVADARRLRQKLGGAIREAKTMAFKPLTLARGHDQIALTFTIEA